MRVNEQPVAFIQNMLCRFAAHRGFYIYRACAETPIGKFITIRKNESATAERPEQSQK